MRGGKARFSLRVGNLYRWFRGLPLRRKDPQRVFNEIYLKNAWQGLETRSGPASSLEQTGALRTELPGMLRDLEVSSLLDAPCGDFHWMKNLDLGLAEYIGVDIVTQLIESNNASYARPGVRFEALDILQDPLPTVDLVLCRDCLIHFSYQHIGMALRNFKASGSTYLATTTFSGRRTNADIATGLWRPINLQLPPFNFPVPLMSISEECTLDGGKFADKSLAVWRLADLPEFSTGR